MTRQADRNPEGQDRNGLGAQHESGGSRSECPKNYSDNSASAEAVIDPQRVEVLCLGKSGVGCTKQRWNEVFAPFTPRGRYHASNLAAHNWDVLLIDGRVLLVCYYGGGHWLPADFGLTNLALPEATDAEISALYDCKQHPMIAHFAPTRADTTLLSKAENQ